MTLIASEDIADIDRELGPSLDAGGHRRNVVTEGVDLHELLGHRFRIGGAVVIGRQSRPIARGSAAPSLLKGTRPRQPCSHVEDLAAEAGVARALGDGRGGICADVIDPGPIGVGDDVVDLGSADRTDEIIGRLRSEE